MHFYSLTAGAPAVIHFTDYNEALKHVTDNRVLSVLRTLGASDRQFEYDRDNGDGKRLRDRITQALEAFPGDESGKPLVFCVA
jgi:hypothetical protein